MPQQGVDLWRPAPKGYERFQRRPASAPRQDLVPKPGAGLRREHALLLEQAVGVSREDLRPLVAVIAGRVATREDVAERIRRAVVVRARHDSHFAADRPEQIEGRKARVRIEIAVQMHVEQRELELADELHAALEVL